MSLFQKDARQIAVDFKRPAKGGHPLGPGIENLKVNGDGSVADYARGGRASQSSEQIPLHRPGTDQFRPLVPHIV
jgi:hypothetical protein